MSASFRAVPRVVAIMGAVLSLRHPPAAEAIETLEDGRIVFVDDASFRLVPEELHLLSPELLGRAKNISLSPDGRLKHARVSRRDREQLKAMMSRYAAWAMQLVERLVPAYRGHMTRARTSFRPAEIENRKTSVLRDDRRLHVDSFPATPMGGQRILRVFANIHPCEPRLWHTGEPFEQMAANFLHQTWIAPPALHGLLAALGATRGRRTPYDDVMLALHNGAKRDELYQASSSKTPIEFGPGAVWLCFTDVVMHAALKGQHALEQSFHLPVEAMADPEKSPLRILERMMGQRLV